ncbi:MAG: signal recognition particle protein Srp54 [Thermoplasmataceae archaeon]
MVLDSFATSIRETLRRIAGSSHIDPETIKEVSKEIQRILLKADVNVKLTLELARTLEKRASEEKPPSGMVEQDFLVRIIYEELLKIMGEESKLEIKPQTIMLVGLYGQGKTTSAGKLSKFFTKKGLSVGLIAADVHRVAAYNQLEQLSKQLNVSFYGKEKEKDPVKVVREGLKELSQIQVKIVDTSGRDSLDDELISEIKELRKAVNPDEVLFVLDATMGQQAGNQARTLNDAVGITGVIISKMDGTGKGGGALSAVASIRQPVYFIGTGEHLEDMEIFNPKRFLSRLMGLGDLESLMQFAEESDISPEEAEKTMSKLMSGKFNLKDMYEIWEKFAQPGLMRKIVDSLPINKMPVGAKIDGSVLDSAEEKLKVYRTIMDSMTFTELEEPDVINASRISRIARGCGRNEADVRSLLREYKAMKKNMKAMQGNRNLKKMLKAQFRGGDFGLENVLGEEGS